MTEKAFLATEPEHYRRLGIEPGIQPFEDGLRTDPTRSGHYEWWYFDAHLDDGSKVVVTFYTKDYAAPKGLAPMITIDLDLSDGRTVNKRAFSDPGTFSASTDGCDVRIAGHRFTGDLHEYTITATIEEVSVDINLTGQTEPWRPATGHIFYGPDESDVFAWLPSVPHGHVIATYRVGDLAVSTEGHGYHDHNWGNVSLLSVVNNWYWGRGAVGPYTFINAYIVSEKKYGYQPVTVFMLARDGKVIADDQEKVTFAKSDVHVDAETGKPVADQHSFTYRNGDEEHELSYLREDTVLRTHFLNSVKGIKKVAARLIGFDGCYIRFVGSVSLTTRRAAGEVEVLREPAIWELMYFGKHAHETRLEALPSGKVARPRTGN